MTAAPSTGHRLTAIHHVLLAMPPGGESDAERFYGDVLGLTQVPKPPELRARGGCWFRLQGVEVHLGVEEEFRPARKAHPAFLVDGLDRLRRRLEEAGVKVIDDVELNGHRRFHSVDPFGNRLEFIQQSSGGT